MDTEKKKITDYLKTFKVDIPPFTHTSMCPPGKYRIPDEKLAEFYRFYSEFIVKHENDNDYLPKLTEKPRNFSPVRVDLDFRFTMDRDSIINDIPERRYTVEIIENFIKLYITEIERWLDLCDQDRLCFITEKTQPSVDHHKQLDNNQVLVKDGIHLMFPYLLVPTDIQLNIREYVLREMPSIFNEMRLSNKYSDVLDKQIIDCNNWMMYLSRKRGLTAIPYRLTHIYEAYSDHVDRVDNNFPVKDLVPLLSVRSEYSDIECSKRKLSCSIRVEKQTELEEQIKEYKIKAELTKAPRRRGKRIKNNKVSEDELDICRRLVGILGVDRAKDRNTWIRVGWALHNIDKRLYPDWVTFSKLATEYSGIADHVCYDTWNDMYDEGLGKLSLRYWAKDDNPEKYREILDLEAYNSIVKSIDQHMDTGDDTLNKALRELKLNPYDVANVLHTMFKHEFVCYNTKGPFGEYYYFNMHRWQSGGGDTILWTKVSEAVPRAFIKVVNEIVKKKNDNNIENNQQYDEMVDEWKSNSGRFTKMLDNLKQTHFKNNVMKEAKSFFYDKTYKKKDKFLTQLDANANLIGFDNGVYDLLKNEFRNGRPEDYLSMSTNIDYTEYNWEDDEINEVFEFVSQVLPDQDEREYVLTLLASFLNGANRNEKFHIWTGCHAKDTNILLYNNTIKKVQDINETDILMGDDSTSRKINKLIRGIDDIYEISYHHKYQFRVNSQHMLCLKVNRSVNVVHEKTDYLFRVTWLEHGDIFPIRKSKLFNYYHINDINTHDYPDFTVIKTKLNNFIENLVLNIDFLPNNTILEMTVDTYLKYEQTLNNEYLTLYSNVIDFQKQDVTYDPYLIGFYLGNKSFYTKNKKVLHYLTPTQPNLENIKTLPLNYIYNEKSVRLSVLAGLLDGNGYFNQNTGEFIVKNVINENLELLFRSLNINYYLKKNNYYLSGNILLEIPLLTSKISIFKPDNKDTSLNFRFQVKYIGKDSYYGFNIDNNHRYITPDLIVHHNCGGNGKSKLIELFQAAIGDYGTILPITLLTKARKASGEAAPELAQTKGKRFAVLQEPDVHTKINVGLMKELSGGDTITARALYQDPIEFKPQIKMVLTCNHLPGLPYDDEATWRRVRSVEFKSTFLDHNVYHKALEKASEKEKKYIFTKDTTLSEKFPYWKEPFMWILIKYYDIWRKQGLKEPQSVIAFTEKYKAQNDKFRDFVNDYIVKDESAIEPMKMKDVWQQYTKWYSENQVESPSSKMDLKLYLEKKFGQHHHQSGGWVGYRIKFDEEEEDNICGI